MRNIVGLIIAGVLWLVGEAIGEAICKLTETIKPIAEYYYKKQRNQL